jgi:hypothetical protein
MSLLRCVGKAVMRGTGRGGEGEGGRTRQETDGFVQTSETPAALRPDGVRMAVCACASLRAGKARLGKGVHCLPSLAAVGLFAFKRTLPVSNQSPRPRPCPLPPVLTLWLSRPTKSPIIRPIKARDRAQAPMM